MRDIKILQGLKIDRDQIPVAATHCFQSEGKVGKESRIEQNDYKYGLIDFLNYWFYIVKQGT